MEGEFRKKWYDLGSFVTDYKTYNNQLFFRSSFEQSKSFSPVNIDFFRFSGEKVIEVDQNKLTPVPTQLRRSNVQPDIAPTCIFFINQHKLITISKATHFVILIGIILINRTWVMLMQKCKPAAKCNHSSYQLTLE